MSEMTSFELDRDQIRMIFNQLLRTYPTPLVKYNEHIRKTIEMFWGEVWDRDKWEALWNEKFREHMDRWGISYEADLERLGIPKVLGDEEEEDDEEVNPDQTQYLDRYFDKDTMIIKIDL